MDELERAIDAFHSLFVDAWRTNRFPYEEESEEAVRWFEGVV